MPSRDIVGTTTVIGSSSTSGTSFQTRGPSPVALLPGVAEDRVVRISVAQLSALPHGHALVGGPLIITIEEWSDGSFAARWPEARLAGGGESDSDALHDLAGNIVELFSTYSHLSRAGERFVAGAADTWNALRARVAIET